MSNYKFIKTININNNIYSPYIDNLIIYIFYIIKKYKNRLHYSTKNKKINMIISNFDSIEAKIIKYRVMTKESLSKKLNCFIEYYNSNTYYCPKLPNTLPKNKLTFYILSLINSKMNHTNIIIIDNINKVIERFDPEGTSTSDSELDSWIINKFKKYNYTYYGLCQYSYSTNLYQLIELELQDLRPGDPVGYCSAWVLWYLEMRLLNPRVHPEKLYFFSLKKISRLNVTIRDYIRNYANNLVKEITPLIYKMTGKKLINKNYYSDDDNKLIKKYIDTFVTEKLK